MNEHISSNDTMIDSLGECIYPSPLQISKFIDDSQRIAIDIEAHLLEQSFHNTGTIASFENAGPRKKIFFNPETTRAAIVTCGGLCPGINNVIQGIVRMLNFQYGIKTIYGVRYGFEGLIKRYGHSFIELTPAFVHDLHEKGGTVLGSSRGYQDEKEIVATLVEHGINILFIIGGDGSLRGAYDIYQEVKRQKLPIAIVGIPKTIDNDIWFVDKTFGFSTAVSTAAQAIYAAHSEAIGAKNGIGIVRVMGRDAGYIAAYVTLASNEVNYCLVPEVHFDLDGPYGFLPHLEKRLYTSSHAVIVVSEGAGQEYFTGPKETDASGNIKYGDIGLLLKDKITAYCKERGIPVTIKYIDTSYLVRSVPASSDDAVYCIMLAQNAVHGAMAGKTGFVVGSWHSYYTYIPLSLVTKKRKRIDPNGYLWSMVKQSTCQPDFFAPVNTLK